jgi:hypothetical protein
MRFGLRILRALARRSSVVVGTAVFLLSQSAAAAGIAIRYQAPEGCGTPDDFQAGVSRIVGKPIAELHSAWTSADVSIAASEGGFRLSVRVVPENGSPRERHLSVSSCREALEAAELIVATNLSAPPPAPPSAPPGEENEASSAPAQAKAPRLTIENRPTKSGTHAAEGVRSTALRGGAPLHVLLGARLGLDPLLAPAPVALGWGMLGLEVQRVRLELTAGASSHASSAVAGGGAVVHAWLAAGLVGCYSGSTDSRGGVLRLWLCAGAEGGRFRASGQSGMNLRDAHSNDSFWSAALVQGELLARLTRGLSFAIGVQGVVALRSVHVTESNPQTGELVTLYSTPWVSARPWVGLDWRF